MLLENYRRLRKERETTTSLDDLVAEGREPRDQSATVGGKSLNHIDDIPDARHCIAKCLHELSLDQRDLLVRYFADGKNKHNRAVLAAHLGISRGALHSRASNLYSRVRTCHEACLRRTNESPDSFPEARHG